ncbi:MAG: hypothetical protein A2046_06090 [Bacteroidetes bacterium GWA2_30_7]|nr:MAG: hypothetical protein A2046_06090 [Bacteroidetes bacterium GWA2_30_7]
MKNKNLFFSIIVLFLSTTTISGFAQKSIGGYYTYETECLGVELDGSQTVKSWGSGRNREDAIEQAKKNAVRDVLFNGIKKGKPDCNVKPVIFEVNAQEKYEDYFNKFFTDGGEYDKFCSPKDGSKYHFEVIKDRQKAGSQETYALIVRVLRADLKAKMVEDNIIKSSSSSSSQNTSSTSTSTTNNSASTTTESTTTEEPQYRGDPLKGLDVSTAKKEMEIGNYYALIIGIDNYQGEWPKLKNAVADAKAVESLLKSKYRFNTFHTLYNEKATRDNVIQEFEWLVQNVKSKDNVLIYYSGHGDFKQELNKGYWVPVDAAKLSTSNYISNNDIQTFLGGIKSNHTLLISDACFSGDIFRGKTVSFPYENTEKYYQKVYNLPSRKAISSGGIEPVMDGGRDGHSVFAYYLLKSLNTNANKYFDASQLYENIKIPIVNNSEQTPNFQPIKDSGDEGGQFLFILKEPEETKKP